MCNRCLLRCCRKGLIPTSRELTNQARLEYVDPRDGNTALHWSIWNRDVKTSIKIIESGHAKLDHPDHEGNTPLLLAAQRGLEPIVHKLLSYESVNPGHANNHGCTPLMMAARAGNSKCASLILGTGRSKPYHISRNGNIAYDLAKRKRCRGVMMLLRFTNMIPQHENFKEMTDYYLELCLSLRKDYDEETADKMLNAIVKGHLGTYSENKVSFLLSQV